MFARNMKADGLVLERGLAMLLSSSNATSDPTAASADRRVKDAPMLQAPVNLST